MKGVLRSIALCLTILAAATAATASEWANWRGPDRNGTSPETGLISEWSQDGQNLIWRQDFTGRSTPVVLDGKVCANGRAGEGIMRQEMVACFDAETGEKLWEFRFNIFHTSVPWNRVGWANLTADPETGYLYVQGVGGPFFCLDSETGEIVWTHSLVEEYGFMEGYGGRTQTPTVDGDQVIVSFSNTSWGNEAKPLHRYRSFDKRTGEELWVSAPAPSQADKNTQSTPAPMDVDGRHLIVAGNGGGGIYAIEASTGEPVWGFQLSKRGINVSVLVEGTTVFAAHSEENIDGGPMGRVVAIDGTGSGDVTETHELWRTNLGVGFSSPAYLDGRLYVVDNASNLHVLDAATGKILWNLDLGRVGKASPVLADGKLFATEVNGRFLIVEPGDTAGRILDLEEIHMPDGSRYAEIYGSPAIAYGRIYFTTEEGIYCLGDKSRPFPDLMAEAPAAASVAPAAKPWSKPAVARLRVMPAEVMIGPEESATFRVEAFDDKGHPLGTREASWSLDGLAGSVSASGVVTPDPEALSQTGMVVAKVGDLTAAGRVRVAQWPPLREDFESTAVGSRPEYMMAYLAVWKVEDETAPAADGGEPVATGNKVLAKGPSPIKIDRHITLLGRDDLSEYTIAGDVMGTQTGRRIGDVGLINSGYTLEMLGIHQQLQVRTWQAGLRMAKEVDFPWQPGIWYRMKLRVEQAADRAIVRGKVWPRDEAEPAEWSIVVEDPLPIRQGAPGLSAYSPSFVYYDNLEVTSN